MERVFNKSLKIIIAVMLLITVLGMTSSSYAKFKINIKVTSVKLNFTTATMNPGDKLQLKTTIKPSYATNKNIKWTTNNSNVATVSSSGLVTAKAGGKATITATSESNSKKKATCTVTVNKSVEVVGFTIDTKSKSIYEAQSFTITGKITPENAKNKNITWKSSNTSIATVNRRHSYR